MLHAEQKVPDAIWKLDLHEPRLCRHVHGLTKGQYRPVCHSVLQPPGGAGDDQARLLKGKQNGAKRKEKEQSK